MSNIVRNVENGKVTYQYEDGTEVSREALKKYFVERGTSILVEADTLKSDLGAVKEEAKAAGFDKKNIGVLIKHNYKNRIAEEIEELESIQDELDSLFDEDC